MNITGLLHINVNCSDFDRSRAFYEMLGFKVLMPVQPEGTGDVAAAVGMMSYTLRGALMKHPSGTVIDLLEWQDPADHSPPYDRLNHLGLGRIAFVTSDIEADIESLGARGVEFLSAVPAAVAGPRGSTTRFICFRDPDGTVLELVDMGTLAV
ncbi:MAG: VOC family protein [Halieaceae bacterium]|jgi:catechol 2,3-dioxygenase-like lactoylglutathione lyase family enzyme|nr:VOC family protein [Halieaceae bacterium]